MFLAHQAPQWSDLTLVIIIARTTKIVSVHVKFISHYESEIDSVVNQKIV